MSEAKEKLAAVISELGLSITAEFVPFSKSRNAKPKEDGKVWRSLNWRVTLHCKRDNYDPAREAPIMATAQILTTDYAAGEAHCPAYKASVARLGTRNSVMRDAVIAWECEHGRAGFCGEGVGGIRAKAAKPLMPDTCDVVYSLVRDADVLDSTFEEWASGLGYDPDSRKAEAIYRACLETALKLRNGIGEAALAKLREACQDY